MEFKRLREGAKLPEYATAGAACVDIYYPASMPPVTIYPNNKELVPSGLALEIPPNYALLLFSRSGHAAKFDVSLANSVGVIDSDYRGEVCGLIRNDGFEPFTIHPGERFMQAMAVPVPRMHFREVAELSSTGRGEGGFGSTGKDDVLPQAAETPAKPSQQRPLYTRTHTSTYVVMGVSSAVYEEVADKLRKAGYGASITSDGLDLSGIFLQSE